MSCMNAFVHDLHHSTKLQLSTRCIVLKIRHKLGINFRVEKSVRNLHTALMNCVFLTVIGIGQFWLCNNTL